MDEKLRHQLKIKKVREMKNPTILMNKTDFETFKKEVEAKVNNFKVGENPTYEGIPIKTKDFIEEGNIIIYDDVMISILDKVTTGVTGEVGNRTCWDWWKVILSPKY